MAALAPFDELHEIIGSGAVVLAILCALAVGTRPYKLAGLVMILETFSWLAFAWIFDRYDRVLFSHGKSIVVAVLFAAILVRHRGLPLVLLASLQMVAVLIHLSVWVERSILADVNALVLNAIGWMMLALITGGSIHSRWGGATPARFAEP
ncbi:MAG TPA: hypothetical protein VFF66_06650 [Brevundimonas sp.]|nr:hypothetical protein [Brevundimonas sp.]